MTTHPNACTCFDCMTRPGKSVCDKGARCLATAGHSGKCVGPVDMIRLYLRTTLADMRKAREARRKAS